MQCRKLRFTLIVAASIAALCGCASTPPSTQSCGPQPSEEQVAGAVQAYLQNYPWKDPESVRFQNVRLQTCQSHWKGLANGGGYLIGWEIDFDVNAKNSYGGYTGFQLHSLILTADGQIHYDQ